MSKAAVGDEVFRRPTTSRRRRRSSVTGTVRADARARAATRSTSTSSRYIAESHDYPITPKEHGVDYLLDRRHLWIRSPRQQAILRVRHEVINAVRDYFNSRGFILADTPIFTPAACEGTTTLFPVQYFEDTTAYLTQSGQLYNEANAMALGQGVLLRPDVPRREVEDAAAPDRVLDGRAGDGVRGPRRRDRAGRGARRRRSSAACSTSGSAELKVLERDTSKLESGARRRFRASPTTRRRRSCTDKGLPFEYGGDLGGTDETVLSEQFDRPVCVHALPGGGEGVLHEAGSRAARQGAVRRRARAGRLRRDHRRRPASRRSTICCCSASRSTTCRRKRSSGISTCAATASVPHGGFGMGIERVVAWICGLEHVRETIPYPRMLYRLYP